MKLEKLNLAKEIYTYPLDILQSQKAKLSFQNTIKKTSRAILLADTNTSNITRLIHILRSDIKWDGAFIAVVRTNKQKEELESSSLFFQREFCLYEDKNSFGHEVEFHPIKLCKEGAGK